MSKGREGEFAGKWMYEIRVEGELGCEWSAWFDGLTVAHERNPVTGEVITVIFGILPDQSALHGLLNKIRDLNLTILSFHRKS
jgi:hypothetical protein